ncbi:toprim domain-containing protein [Bacillus thuringiensis]|uniref:toprim domain-containing protein n=1 Tax=Bacillus thuringiensis TaxID=1428 RepID=UPI000BFCD1C7|nr:toprim domain-containing protein [Bacillus thuringiensis]PGM38493.1 hypothetical protein CN945_01115 [Bacillus thuringiensis]
MTLVWVRDQKLDIDLTGELSGFTFEQERWTEDKLTCASPFRYDQHPSFFVNLENLPGKEIAGTWKDSGSGETGSFLKLLSHLRGEDPEETFYYLMEMYAPKAYSEAIDLTRFLEIKKEFKPLECNLEAEYSYLLSRSISKKTQDLLDVRGSGDKVAFLWKNPRGEIQAIKYRLTNSKVFYYEKNGQRLNTLLYGIDQVYQHKCRTIAITEAEIDALSWWEHGRGAVALGGSSISKRQVDLLKQSGVENIIISTDSDKTGQKLARIITKMLHPYFNLFKVRWTGKIKDVNEYIREFSKTPALIKISRF